MIRSCVKSRRLGPGANVAYMGLLASMGAGMDSQGRALDEAFCTIWKTAAIGSFIHIEDGRWFWRVECTNEVDPKEKEKQHELRVRGSGVEGNHQDKRRGLLAVEGSIRRVPRGHC
ncbi:predicted protein [Histoplasma mississippiense (nom. inval.)]|uniref:predicted protein n=1 Tax=Ajellomyces capsulatus (strain NAm1 / WU24) TaxID=2059318 RepID=UPI000157B7A8|nr:predicted protein [Histoplasma mississippiense (nom. inval.)]EDN03690.1 predicted protein [Histoplasma mississippiense (nom. inval.)]